MRTGVFVFFDMRFLEIYSWKIISFKCLTDDMNFSLRHILNNPLTRESTEVKMTSRFHTKTWQNKISCVIFLSISINA